MAVITITIADVETEEGPEISIKTPPIEEVSEGEPTPAMLMVIALHKGGHFEKASREAELMYNVMQVTGKIGPAADEKTEH